MKIIKTYKEETHLILTVLGKDTNFKGVNIELSDEMVAFGIQNKPYKHITDGTLRILELEDFAKNHLDNFIEDGMNEILSYYPAIIVRGAKGNITSNINLYPKEEPKIWFDSYHFITRISNIANIETLLGGVSINKTNVKHSINKLYTDDYKEKINKFKKKVIQ